jgi:hypothetical protein
LEIRGVATKEQADRLYCIVLPFVDRNLFASLKQQRFGDEEKFLFIQLVMCVQHLHSKGIIHAEIRKLNNIREGIKNINQSLLISMPRVEFRCLV